MIQTLTLPLKRKVILDTFYQIVILGELGNNAIQLKKYNDWSIYLKGSCVEVLR